MSDVLTDRHSRSAHIRAQAAALVDSPRRQERFAGAPAAARTDGRRRRTAPPPRPSLRPTARTRRRLLAGVICLLQLCLLAAMLTLPVFRVSRVVVSGNHLMSQQTILDAAEVPSGSIFTVNGDAIQARLMQVPWVRQASVVPSLPGTVTVTVTEWSPVLRLRSAGSDYLLAASGAQLPTAQADPKTAAAVPVYLEMGGVATATPPDPKLISLLDEAAAKFPSLFGCSVAAFVLGSDGVLTAWTSAGWGAILGHVAGSDEVAQIPAKVTALSALTAHVDFAHPNFGYVDLEDPGAPAVGGKPGIPQDVAAALAAPPIPVGAAPVRAMQYAADGMTLVRDAAVATMHRVVGVLTARTALTAPGTAPPPGAAAAPTPKPVPVAPTPTPYVIYVPPSH